MLCLDSARSTLAAIRDDLFQRFPRLHSTALALLNRLLMHANRETWETTIATSTLAARLHLSIRTVDRHLAELRRLGLVAVTIAKTARGRARLFRITLPGAPTAAAEPTPAPAMPGQDVLTHPDIVAASPPAPLPSERNKRENAPSIPPGDDESLKDRVREADAERAREVEGVIHHWRATMKPETCGPTVTNDRYRAVRDLLFAGFSAMELRWAIDAAAGDEFWSNKDHPHRQRLGTLFASHERIAELAHRGKVAHERAAEIARRKALRSSGTQPLIGPAKTQPGPQYAPGSAEWQADARARIAAMTSALAAG